MNYPNLYLKYDLNLDVIKEDAVLVDSYDTYPQIVIIPKEFYLRL